MYTFLFGKLKEWYYVYTSGIGGMNGDVST